MSKKRKVVATSIALLVIAVLVVFSINNLLKTSYETDPSVRGKNIDNLRVYTSDTSYEIKNNTLVKNYEVVIKNVDEKSLSIIDDVGFFFTKDGFVKFDFNTEDKQILNYDVMDFAVAGLNYIYYTADGHLYRLGIDNNSTQIDDDVFEKLFVVDNNLYYASNSSWYSINLEDDVKSNEIESLGKINEAVFTNNQIIIVTDQDVYKINIEEVSDED